jgi:Ca-activated chloride channel family protein
MNAFHFIRPWLLLALVPAAVLIVLLIRRSGSRDGWSSVLDPQLLAVLEVIPPGKSGWFRPIHLLTFCWVAMILVLAGPTWNQIPSPLAEDHAALVLVLKASESMNTRDVQPSRLIRAQQKVEDLMPFRKGTDHALVVYAGSAHRVMPLTRDPGIIAEFARSIETDIMPKPGEGGLAEALGLAAAELERTGKAGSVLLIADAVLPDDLEAAREVQKKTGMIVHVLGVGNKREGAWDADALKRDTRTLGGTFTEIQPDTSDVERIAAVAESEVSLVGGALESVQWAESGYWLLPFLAAAGLFWFRPGWNVEYS